MPHATSMCSPWPSFRDLFTSDRLNAVLRFILAETSIHDWHLLDRESSDSRGLSVWCSSSVLAQHNALLGTSSFRQYLVVTVDILRGVLQITQFYSRLPPIQHQPHRTLQHIIWHHQSILADIDVWTHLGTMMRLSRRYDFSAARQLAMKLYCESV